MLQSHRLRQDGGPNDLITFAEVAVDDSELADTVPFRNQ